jgi:alpha-mannosidase
MVYDDAEKLYDEVRKDGEALLEAAFGVLFPPGSVALGAGTTTNLKALPLSAEVVGYNTTFFPRSDVIQVPPALSTSQVVQTQTIGGAEVGYAVMSCAGGGGVGRFIGPEEGLYAQIMPVSGAVFSFVWFELSSRG